MPFLTELVTKSLPGKKMSELTEPLVYRDSRGRVFIACEGFKTDLASIPRLLRPIIDDDDAIIRLPSVIHDKLYQTRQVSRYDADVVLYEAMRECGSGITRASIVFISVRVFGWLYYRKKPTR